MNLAAKFLGVGAPKARISRFLVKMMTVGRSFDDAQLQFLLSDRVVSIDRIKSEIGFRPKCSMEVEGKKMVERLPEGAQGDQHGGVMS